MHSVAGFMLVELIFALGLGCISGADEALFYDSLKVKGEELAFSRYWGRIRGITMACSALWFIVGGLLADSFGLEAPYQLGMLVMLGFVTLSMFLTEVHSEESLTCKLGTDVSQAWSVLARGKQSIQIVVLASAFLFAMNQSFFWQLQPYLLELEVPLSFNGLILAALGLLGSTFAATTSRWQRYISPERFIGFSVVALPMTLLVIGWDYRIWPLGLIVIHQFIRAGHCVLFSEILHGEIDSKLRATAMSLRNMIDKIGYGIWLVGAGLLVDEVGLATSLWWQGVIGLVCVGVVGGSVLLLRHSALKVRESLLAPKKA